jgi:hypothetical protein
MIQNIEHVFITGFTGSGKTYLAEKYLENPRKHVICLDIKGNLKYKCDMIVTTLEQLKAIPFKKSKKIIKVIYRPSIYEMNDETYDEFFKFCYYLKNITLWVDEVSGVCPSAFKIPFHYMSILARGRSRNTNVYSLSQRTKSIPINILSESTHYFIFKLNAKGDRQRLYEYTGDERFLKPPEQEFHFFYFNNKTGYFSEGVLT